MWCVCYCELVTSLFSLHVSSQRFFLVLKQMRNNLLSQYLRRESDSVLFVDDAGADEVVLLWCE